MCSDFLFRVYQAKNYKLRECLARDKQQYFSGTLSKITIYMLNYCTKFGVLVRSVTFESITNLTSRSYNIATPISAKSVD